MNGCCVPLYDTFGDEAVQYIIEHSELKLINAQVLGERQGGRWCRGVRSSPYARPCG